MWAVEAPPETRVSATVGGVAGQSWFCSLTEEAELNRREFAREIFRNFTRKRQTIRNKRANGATLQNKSWEILILFAEV